MRCRRLPALFLLCLLPGGRNLGLVFSNSLKAAIPWTRRRSAGAASASSPPSPEEGRESACRTSTTSQAAPRERAASPSRKGPSLRGSRFPTAKRRDKSNTRRRRCATDRDMAHGVFHSKGDRPRGGTGGLRIRLCHHDLHDRKHPGAPARPVPRRRGPDRHLTPVSPPAGGITPPRTCAASRRCAPGSWPGSASRSSPARSGRFARWRSLLWPFSSPSRSPCTPTNKYLSENKRALILRSALSRLYAKAHYRPAS